MSTIVRASSDHTPVIEIHRQSDTHALVGCPTRKASERPMSHVSRQASVSILDLFDAIRTELGAIVIDKTELPEVGTDAGERILSVNTSGTVTPQDLRAEANHWLALAAYLEANPPIDEAAVSDFTSALIEVEMDHPDTPLPHTVARRLVAAGWRITKDPT